MLDAILALEDGKVFYGRSFGWRGERTGEVVFNTSMTGYQEVLTDPSYKGQMVAMTYPHIGNYGINDEDSESDGPKVEAFLVREYSRVVSNWRADRDLATFLQRHEVIGLSEIDTRTLTRHIRSYGAMKAAISTVNVDEERLVKMAQEAPDISDRDLVSEVTCSEPFEWTEGTDREWLLPKAKRQRFHVVAYDCGIKRDILRRLVDVGCRVRVVPAATPASKVRAFQPDGLFLSNGPGDPEMVPYVVRAVRSLLGELPIFGICLGHQVLGLALGGRTYKLKFGHHGGNQPVKDMRTGQVQITAQNHNFAVAADSLGESEVEVTHINLNDQTVEGLRHRRWPLFSVQYHPEAAPGPHDADPLFQQFVDMIEEWKG
ncbi:MAG: glutamine-hydrolyzing carbamoyl-phosphate synthase small subunit [Chloroflexota bacterium]|nr:glutamine-hydrolyzing carbamoyl-phosphate synthase small subunit [Chloroflexota bacterium]